MTILLFIHVIITLAMIGSILLQRSEGGGLGMGASPTSSMFSARGTANLLTHVTAVLFTLFVANSLLMGAISKKSTPKIEIFSEEHPSRPTAPEVPSK
jgi:preprotein translocase subunit SecG